MSVRTNKGPCGHSRWHSQVMEAEAGIWRLCTNATGSRLEISDVG